MSRKLFALLVLIGLCSAPAFAVPKEIIQLQQQVALLMNQVQDLQSAFTSNVAVIKSLLSQNTDTVNKLTLAVNNIQQSLNNQNSANSQSQGQTAQQFQAVNDSLDELRGRLSRMEDVLKQIQTAQQTIQSAPAPAPAPGQPTAGQSTAGQPSTGPAVSGNAAPPDGSASAAAPNDGLPPTQLFQNALSDYVSGSYPLAKDELRQYLSKYPDGGHDAEAAYYLGDIYSKERDYRHAVTEFDTVIQKYPNHHLIPGAHLKKGYALLAMGSRSAGIKELRNLITRYPTSQEAKQAKEQLRVLGVSSR